MCRLRDEVRNTNPRILIRSVHDLKANMIEIYRLKGKIFLQVLILKRAHLLVHVRFAHLQIDSLKEIMFEISEIL